MVTTLPSSPAVPPLHVPPCLRQTQVTPFPSPSPAPPLLLAGGTLDLLGTLHSVWGAWVLTLSPFLAPGLPLRGSSSPGPLCGKHPAHLCCHQRHTACLPGESCVNAKPSHAQAFLSSLKGPSSSPDMPSFQTPPTCKLIS